MKYLTARLVLLLVLVILAGCGSSPGPDSISSQKPQSSGALPDCIACHSSAIFSRRQIFGTGGDFGANTNLVSHHVAGTSDPSSDQCLVCHDLSTHMFGTIRLKHGDTGASIAYDPANPSSLESFCLSCHDASGATSTALGGNPFNPFNDGSTLGNPPYPYATRIAASWAKSYGHGPNGKHAFGTRLTCLGDGTSGTGCHGNNGQINAHGSVNQVLAARQFKYDINYMNFTNQYNYNAEHFDLCFNCHSNYAGVRVTKEDTLGVKFGGLLDDPSHPNTFNGYGNNAVGPRGYKPPYEPVSGGVTTHFADHDETGGAYSDGFPFWGFTVDMNLHWFHLGWMAASFRGPGECSIFSTPSNCSGITCVNCHDVHGSNTPFGVVYDEIGYSHFDDGINFLGQMGPDAYDWSQDYLNNSPMFCAFNCHPYQGETKAWFAPITE